MKKIFLYSTITILLVIILVIAIALIYFNMITKDTRLDLEKLERAKQTTIISNEDIPLNNDDYVCLEDIPKTLINAFISVEDRRFYTHNGIDIRRMCSAMWYNLTHGSKAQGASTITQQLVKNTHLTNKKTFDRKLKEIKLALLLEKKLSKNEILERYLNSLYFGSGIYGVKNVALVMFGKELNDLNISECATIAGIVKAPEHYSPLKNLSRSKERRNVVLKAMYDNNMIDNATYINTKNSDIIINNDIIHNNIADFYLKQTLYETSLRLGIPIDEVMSANFKIATYYDVKAQKSLIDSITSTKEYTNEKDVLSLLLDNKTSGINGSFGSIDTNIFEYKRQVGSIMKPLAVYLPALEYGLISPATIYDDTKKNFNGYSPSNYGDHYRGKISIRNAVMHSSNIVAVDVLNTLTINKSKAFLSKMGIDLPDNGLSIALGGLSVGLSPIDIIGGYETIANGGCYSMPTFIRYIQDENGKIIYRHDPVKSQICTESSSYLMTDMLVSTARYGTAKKLSSLPYDIASKTGTVASINDKSKNTDCYNLSYTTNNTLLVWLGGQLDSSIQGGGLPTIIAREIYTRYYRNNHPANFVIPKGVVKLNFDKNEYDNNYQIFLTDDTLAYSDLFDERYMPEKKIIDTNNIKYTYSDNKLTLVNIANTDIKIYSEDISHKKTLERELINTSNIESVPLKSSLFKHYIVEIYYREKLVKTIRI